MTTDLIRILLIEDDPDDILLLKESLAETSAVRIKLAHADRLSEGLKRITEQKFDVILLDLNLPDSLGLDTLSSLLRQAPAIPIVVISGLTDDITTLEAVRQGAQDYMVKGEISGALLGRVLRYAIERKRAEEVLRENEERFSSAFEYAPIGMALVALDGSFIKVNHALCGIVGYSNKELLAKTFQDITHPDDLQADLAFIHQMLAGEIHTYQMEKRYFHQLGQVVRILLSVSLVHDTQNQPLYFVSQIQDITERKQADDALRESEARFSTVFQSSPVRIAISRFEDGLFLDVNKGFLDSTGYAREDVIGHTSSELKDWAKPAERIRLHRLLKEQGPVREFEAQLRQKSGQIRDVLMSADIIELFGQRCILSVGVDITERKQAEEALRAAEEKYRAIFEGAIEGIFQSTAEGRFLTVNPVLARMWGYASPGELLSSIQNIAQQVYVQPERRAEFSRLLQEQGDVHGFESEVRCKGGGTIWISENARAVRDARGTLLYYEGNVQDISVRKRAEEALYEQQQVFRTLVENSPDIVARYDRDCHRTYVNPMYLKVAQMPQQELLATSPIQRSPLPAASAEVLQNFLRRVFDSGVADAIDVVWPKADNIDRWYNIYASPEFDREERVVSVMAISRDITERKQMEVDLQKRISQLALINDVGSKIVSVLDLSSVLEMAARLVHESFDYYHVALFILERESNELVMKARAGNFANIFPNEYRVGLGEGVVGWSGLHGEKILANDVTAEPRYVNRFPEQLPTQSELSLPMKLGEQVVGVLDVQSSDLQAFNHEDVSVLETLAAQVTVAIENARLYETVQNELVERKKAEAELLQYRDNLEMLVKDRTAELVIAKERAEAANQAKSAFLAAMSHEIRTPLNGVLGMTHLAMQSNPTEKQRDYLTNIRSSGEILLSTINDILDFSKIEAGKIALEQVDFDLDTVLQPLTNHVAHKAREKNLELVFHTAPEVPRLLIGDPHRLGQVLTNLVGNAVKFTESGEVVVKASLVKKTAQNVTLEFSVRDSGIGLTHEQMGQLFQPFSQADTSTSRKYGGTGLGLTISQRLVNMMGGEIKVESRFEQGTTFTFRIDLKPQAATKQNDLVTRPELSGLRVLVVDDHAATREFLESVLKSFTFQVSTADSAEAALARLEQEHSEQRFDLVIMDKRMPGGMDGLEAIRQIKRHPGLSKLPTLLLVQESEMTQPIGEGSPDGYLLKPFTRSQLFNAIMQIFGYQAPVQSWPVEKNPATGSLNQLRGKRALLVDDNEINQLVAGEMLQNLGLQVTLASSGEEAIRILKTGMFDIVLMDIQMPGMDGYQATAQIRTDPRFTYADLPIIALTAHALTGDREKTLKAGLNDYITKPIDMEQLTSTLLCWLAPQPGQTTVEQIQMDTSRAQKESIPPAEPDLIHQKSALVRLGNNENLYSRLLVMFHENQGQVAQTIRAALHVGDIPLAHRLAHTLKSTAATIGANRLSLAAKNLETALAQENSSLYEADLEQVELELTAALAEVVHMIESAPAVEQVPTLEAESGPADLQAQLVQLAQLLNSRDAKAVGFIENLLRQSHEPGLQTELEALERIIKRYDFKNALTNLSILAEKRRFHLPKPTS